MNGRITVAAPHGDKQAETQDGHQQIAEKKFTLYQPEIVNFIEAFIGAGDVNLGTIEWSTSSFVYVVLESTNSPAR